MKKLLLTLLLSLPLYLSAQDTLVAEVRIRRSPDGQIHIVYKKDTRYSNDKILEYILQGWPKDTIEPKKEHPKIKKM